MNDKVYIFKNIDEWKDEEVDFFRAELSEERKQKLKKYRKKEDQKLSAMAYLLLRYALVKDFNIREKITLVQEGFGKPYLQEYKDIYFNFSHCSSCAVCAVSTEKIGVDIEYIAKERLLLSELVLAQEEMELVRCAEKKEETFVRLWVLKESTVKRDGVGLLYGVNHLNFSKDEEGIFYKYNRIYHTRKINNLYIAVCGQNPAEFIFVSKNDLKFI